MQFSINTACLLPGLTFAQALSAVRAHGYDLVEAWGIPAQAVQPTADALRTAGARMSTFCTDAFTLNDPTQHEAYEEALKGTLEKARLLQCPTLITQVGNALSAPRMAQHDAIVTGLRRVVPLLAAAGVTLLVEPLNDVKDHIGYYLTDSNEGFDIIREVDSPNVRLLFDIYHQVHMGEDVLTRINDNLALIAHFHIAGHPKRDAGLFTNFDYAPVLDMLRQSGTSAPVGLELMPATQAEAEALLDTLAAYR